MKNKLIEIGGVLLRVAAIIFLVFCVVVVFLMILNNVIRPLWGLVRKIFWIIYFELCMTPICRQNIP